MVTKYTYHKDLVSQSIIEDLQQGNTIVLIENFPLIDADLQTFIKPLGVSVKEIRNNNGKDVFDVKVKKQNGFFTSIANSNLTFPLHTDCADFASIPNCIGLLCVQPATDNQGKSRFVFLEEILKQLSKEEIQELTSKKWNFRGQSRSILSLTHNGYKICYDRITMETFSKLNDAEKKYLSKLDRLFEKNIIETQLKKGDLILFRNDLLLHGRTKIDLDSDRLLKRIRFDLK
ncbi:MAG: TauD/TfdA family dioxygenase [Kordia sp.]|uniref:TauD/TfdA family dioxygenase n=1 Tax=Kordia sp. TaxID=1965332 RepID=UPI003859814F